VENWQRVLCFDDGCVAQWMDRVQAHQLHRPRVVPIVIFLHCSHSVYRAEEAEEIAIVAEGRCWGLECGWLL
jgi:hypothetical protein